ncbi:alpha/beta hydrolase family protein [Jonesia quinghaiensis]|uniref:alpha/beta hydrolase family protein n=1 Tax=Jonesia quinghaiensis TaxID=262806 RepID=UPI000429FF88|nr:lipase [Jonesia quinghaiensis]
MRRFFALFLTLAFLVVGGTTPAYADENPLERGPDPTESFIEQRRGNYDVAQRSINRMGSDGFRNGTIYYPTDSSDGQFGVIAISPGYTAGESSIAWLGARMASFGFVVVTINTTTRYDQPRQRSTQLLAALDHAMEDSVVGPMIDPERQAVMGHSMGGGGALQAAESRPEIDAVIPLTPWNLKRNWRNIDAATLIIGAERDTIASVRTHSIPFYESLTGADQRGYLELRGASHFAPNFSNTTIAKYSVAWMKRHLDDDERYEKFLTPGPTVGYSSGVSDYRLQ